jgi:UDP-glucuronate decarboxylase
MNELEGKTILLTGATGLVGTHFLYAFKDLIGYGIKFRVIATGLHGTPQHLVELMEEEWVRYIKLDLTNLASIEDKLGLYDFDVIIHGASYGQPNKFMENALATIKLNTTTTIDLLDRLVSGGKFLFLSSSEVYSGLIDYPFIESEIGITTPYHKRACYIEAKRCGETIVKTYRNNGVDAKSVRLSLAYGEGVSMDDGRVLNVFIRQGLLTGKIKMRDKGDAGRAYIYVQDAVRMMLVVLTKGEHDVYNIGGENSISIADLARMICSKLDAFFFTGNDGDLSAPMEVRLSMDRYNNEFGKFDYTSLDEGLDYTIAYYKKLLT